MLKVRLKKKTEAQQSPKMVPPASPKSHKGTEEQKLVDEPLAPSPIKKY